MKKLLFLIPFILIGCKVKQPIYVPVHDSTTIEATETITEDPTYTDPAEGFWHMLFECDSLNNVVLSGYEARVSGMKENIRIAREGEKKAEMERGEARNKLANEKARNQGLIVNLSAYVDSNEINNKTIEKLRNEKKTIQVPYPVPGPIVKVIPKRFKFYRNILFTLVLTGLGYVVIKYKLWKVFIK